VVSGEPEFYKAAFGSTQDEFEEILSRPHHMIFHRHWYERYDGRPELDEFRSALSSLSPSERAELVSFLSDRNPADYVRDLGTLPRTLQRVATFHIPPTTAQEAEITVIQRAWWHGQPVPDIRLSNEEIVEDAGLDDDGEFAVPPRPATRSVRKVA